ncbi:RluA family pseudouridine synthase [Aliiruegeria lutimaris]
MAVFPRFRRKTMTAGTRLIHVEIAPDPPARLDKALARDVPESEALSRSRLARLIEEGQVARGGTVLSNAKAKVAEGDVIEITLPAAAEVETVPEDIPLSIAYEDDVLIVIDKPAGMVVHPAPGSPSGTLVNALLFHCGDTLSGIGGEKRPGIVHRIDKDTSGLLVVAKSDAAHHGLAAQFEAHSAQRHYLAVVNGCPDPADPRLRGVKGTHWESGEVLRITTQLARHKHDRQRQAVVWNGGRHAVTRARLLEPFGTPPVAALVECRLETGRTHQIRVHMAHVGHGLIGDPIYGGRRKLSARALGEDAATLANTFPRQALHAASLGFKHPLTGEALSFKSPLPADMDALVTALRAG